MWRISFLLDTNRSTRFVQKRAVGVAERVPADSRKTDLFTGWFQDLPLDDPGIDKYPPAEPGALPCEPLKAASMRRLALSRFLSLLLHLFFP